jgi:hypothetical protein
VNIACRRRKSPLENRNLEVVIEKRECTKERYTKIQQQKDLNPFFKTMKPISLEENFRIAAKKVKIGSMKFKGILPKSLRNQVLEVFFLPGMLLDTKCWV